MIRVISAGRILHIFRKKGGSGDQTKTMDEWPEACTSLIRKDLGGENLLIASIHSPSSWIAVTPLKIVSKDQGQVHSVWLSEIDVLLHPGDPEEWFQGKNSGGRLELGLRDGSVFSFRVDDPKPFFGLANVLLYVTKMNSRGRDSR